MSIQVMSAVWERSTAYGGELLIMLAIANYADINGRAFPSIRTLALDGRMTERNAQYCIQKLEALGEIKVERNAGPHGTHIFHVLLQGESFSGCKVFTHKKKRSRNKELTSETGENFSGVQLVQTETHFTGGVKPISPEPSLDPSVKEKIEDTPLPPISETVEPAPPKKKRGRQATPKHPFPEQFLLTVAMKDWAKENAGHINMAQETKKFAAHWRAKGEWMSDWNACWQKWMLNAEGWLQEKYPELATTRTPGQAISHDEVEL